MNNILVHALYGLSGLCVYAAVHHALIAARRPVDRTHLWFALMCITIAAYVIAKAGAYQTDSVQAMVDQRRWELGFAILIFASFPWFVREYAGQRSLWPPLLLSLIMGVVLVANLLLPFAIGYTQLPEFARVTLPWGEQIADLRARPLGIWYHAGWLGMILTFIYALYASWRQFQRGERRRALSLAIAIAVFLVFVLFNRLVNEGVVDFIHTAEFGFLALLLVMNQSLTYDVREIERRMQAVLDNMPAVAYLKDLQGRYLLINRQFEKLFRIERHHAAGHTDYDLFPAAQAERLRANDNRVVHAGTPVQFEETLDIGGESRQFLACKFPVQTASGVTIAVGGTALDVTDTRKLETERDTLRQQVLHADRVARISTLSTSLAHELSQPLTAMLSNAQAGLRFMDQGAQAEDELRDILSDIVRDNERAIAIIGGLRAMLRQKSAARERIGLAETVTEALDLIHDEILRRGGHCERDLQHNCHVLADKVQIEQVILNLVMNALDALDAQPAGQWKLRVTVATDGDGQVRVTVRDSGAGLSPNQVDQIFDSFYSTKSQGLGMGLALCRSIIESHGGRIWANNNTDQGATVQFILPMAKEEQA